MRVLVAVTVPSAYTHSLIKINIVLLCKTTAKIELALDLITG